MPSKKQLKSVTPACNAIVKYLKDIGLETVDVDHDVMATLLYTNLPKHSSETYKDPDCPKKAMSAFLLFSSEKRKTIGKVDFKTMSKLIGKEWRSLSTEDKEIWNSKSATDRKRWKKELQEYIPKTQDELKKIHSKEKRVKRPKSAYLFFCQEERKVITGMTPTQVLSELGKRWRGQSERGKWEKLAIDARKEYEIEKKICGTQKDRIGDFDKRELTSFRSFSRDKGSILKGENPSMSITSQRKILKDKWVEMTPDQKQVYSL